MDERNGHSQRELGRRSDGALASPSLIGAAVVSVAFIAIFAGSALFPPGTSFTQATRLRPSPEAAQAVVSPGGAAGDVIGYYLPENLTVVMGVNNTVTWTNEDMLVHSVYLDGGLAYSGNIEPGKSWTYTFAAPGMYPYRCYLHPWMEGRVIVKQTPAG